MLRAAFNWNGCGGSCLSFDMILFLPGICIIVFSFLLNCLKFFYGTTKTGHFSELRDGQSGPGPGNKFLFLTGTGTKFFFD